MRLVVDQPKLWLGLCKGCCAPTKFGCLFCAPPLPPPMQALVAAGSVPLDRKLDLDCWEVEGDGEGEDDARGVSCWAALAAV